MFKQIRANRYIKMIRPGDIIVVIGLFILSFAPVAVFSWHEWQTTQAADSNAQVLTAYVKHDGKTVYKVNLTTHHENTSLIAMPAVITTKLRQLIALRSLCQLLHQIDAAWHLSQAKPLFAYHTSYWLKLKPDGPTRAGWFRLI